jgi:hypothetical protein
MGEMHRRLAWGIIVLAFATVCDSISAQELDPRAYQPAPIGLNALTLAYTNSTGDILFEPSFPAEDVQANLHLEAAVYYRTFGLFGRFANSSLAVPYAAGHLNGRVEGISTEIYRSGLGDIRTRFAMNIKGTPAMTLPEFIKHRSKTNIGVSLTVSAPTGQYDSKKIVNVGQNRWAFKPEVGLSRFYKKWQMDIYGGAWFFTENDDFVGGTQSQAPVGSFQFHLTYNLRPRCWLGLNTNFYTGGRTTINGVPGATKQNNSRIGSTLMLPLGKSHSIKVAVSKGVIATRGGNFTSVGAAYNYSWGATK